MAAKRYSDKEKSKILDFVKKFDTENGRGGMSQASKKFKVSFLTLRSWIKKSDESIAEKKSPAAKGTPVSNGKKTVAAVAPAFKDKVMSHLANIEKYSKQISDLQALIEKEKESILKVMP